MRVAILIIAVLLLSSCEHEDKNIDKKIATFEELLGRQESLYLNEIISDFDIFLNQKYQTVNKQYRFEYYLKYFIDQYKYPSLRNDELFRLDSSKISRYRKSNLFDKFDLILPDSVWQDSFGINVLYNNQLETIIPVKEGDNYIKELISDLKNKPIKNYTSKSPFYASLDSIKNRNVLITKYLNEKEAATDIGPISLANGIVFYLDESSEYFAKRIFIMELYNH